MRVRLYCETTSRLQTPDYSHSPQPTAHSPQPTAHGQQAQVQGTGDRDSGQRTRTTTSYLDRVFDVQQLGAQWVIIFGQARLLCCISRRSTRGATSHCSNRRGVLVHENTQSKKGESSEWAAMKYSCQRPSQLCPWQPSLCVSAASVSSCQQRTASAQSHAAWHTRRQSHLQVGQYKTRGDRVRCYDIRDNE